MTTNSIKKIITQLLAISFLALFCAPLFSQSAQQSASQNVAKEIEELLQVKNVSYAKAARFVLEAADVAVLKESEAFAFSAERGYLPKNASENQAARLDGVSLLLMRAFAIKGGILYSMTKNPHYAYRELVYQDVIQGKSEPDMPVTGEQLLFLINRVLSKIDGAEITLAEKEQP